MTDLRTANENKVFVQSNSETMQRIFILFLLLITIPQATSAEILNFQLRFYSESIDFQFDNDKLPNDYIRFDEYFAKQYYRQLSKNDFSDLITFFKLKQSEYNLNGWLTYQLIETTVESITNGKSDNYKQLLTWFLLNEMDYDTRLAYNRKQYQLQIHTKDNLFGTPFFEFNNRLFINLSGVNKTYSRTELEFYLIEYAPNPYGKPLDFQIKNFPTFKPNKITKSIRFWANGSRQFLKINLDKNIIDLMNNYPIIEEKEYVERSLSPLIKASLLPQLRVKMKNLNELEKVKFLLGLTRSGFSYKEDNDNFGYNKPMIADEVLYYAFSDCEDRSALFYNLMKELVGLPMIIVTYDDHLTIGVQLTENQGKPLYYKNEKYTICDPTGPNNSDEVGIYPKGYERKSYEIIGSF